MPPTRDFLARIRNDPRSINYEQRASLRPDVTRVGEMPAPISKQNVLIFVAVVLPEDHVVIHPVPPSGPVFIGPDDGERKIKGSIAEKLLNRLLKNAPAVKMIVIEAKSMDTGSLREINLLPQ